MKKHFEFFSLYLFMLMHTLDGSSCDQTLILQFLNSVYNSIMLVILLSNLISFFLTLIVNSRLAKTNIDQLCHLITYQNL